MGQRFVLEISAPVSLMRLFLRHRPILLFLLISLFMHGAGLFLLGDRRIVKTGEVHGPPTTRIEVYRAPQAFRNEDAAVEPALVPASPPSAPAAPPSPVMEAPAPTAYAPPPAVTELPEKPPSQAASSGSQDGDAEKAGTPARQTIGPPELEKSELPRSEAASRFLPKAEETVRISAPLPQKASASVALPTAEPPREGVASVSESVANGQAEALRRSEPALSSAQRRDLLASYQRQVRALIDRQKRYPLMARRRQLEGEVLVSFTIRSDGSLARAGVIRSSGAPLLDQAALDAVRNAGTFPAFPSALAGAKRLPVEVPIDFRLR